MEGLTVSRNKHGIWYIFLWEPSIRIVLIMYRDDEASDDTSFTHGSGIWRWWIHNTVTIYSNDADMG